MIWPYRLKKREQKIFMLLSINFQLDIVGWVGGKPVRPYTADTFSLTVQGFLPYIHAGIQFKSKCIMW